MMRCFKCKGKTVPREAAVEVRFGDTMLTTIAEVGHCVTCNVQTLELQCRINLLGNAGQQPVDKSVGMEVKGNA